MPITWIPSGGANRALDPNLLADNVGVDAVNVEPAAGVMRPLRGRTTVATVPTSPQRQTIYRMGRDTPNDAAYWLSWSTIVNAVRGFDKSDPTERTYFMGSGSPKWTDNTMLGSPPYPQAARELAVPAPEAAATITEATPGSGTEETRYYVHTFINELGWESAPSPVSDGFTCRPGCLLNITGLPAAPAGNYGITGRRIYRTQSGTNGNNTDFFFLREIAIGATSTTDDGRALGDALATTGWIPWPAGAHSLIALWAGMFAALSGKTLHLSEPGIPYAAPVRYDIELQSTGVTTLKWEQNLLVLTTGTPVLVRGQDPLGMTDEPLRSVWPCISKPGAVAMGDGGVWPSSEGLASTYFDRLVTENLISTENWKAMNPDTMIAGRWGRFYVCSYHDGVSRKAFMLDPKAPSGSLVFLSTGFDACDYDELADELYVLEGGNVRKFAAGAFLTASALSKKFKQPAPTTYRFAKVVADAYPLTLDVYTERVDRETQAVTQVLRATKTVTSQHVFTLPGGFSAEEWQLGLRDVTGPVKVARLAGDPRHLKGA